MNISVHVALVAAAGSVVGCVIGCVPGLHVYNLLGPVLLWSAALSSGPETVVPLAAGMLSGWAVANTVSSVLLAAPDESALLTVMPGQKYAMLGRGFEATMVTAAGSLGGAILLVCFVGPLVPRLLPTLHTVFAPHSHWILWVVIAFVLMSEWPRLGTHGQGGWAKFLRAWSGLGAGVLTFLLSGLLGFILAYRSPLGVDVAAQGRMPAFVGLFALPWLILNLVSRAELPPQETPRVFRVGGDLALRGVAVGTLGGLFAAFFPGITGGIGGLLAGHATAQRDERVFLVSQGASKFVYYAGAFLLFFVPGEGMTRGGAASMLRGFYIPRTVYDYRVALASIAIAAAVGFLCVGPLARAVIWLVRRLGYRPISAAAFMGCLIIVAGFAGLQGLLVMAVATGIGLLPPLFHSRRINCLGVVLLPAACGMSGAGSDVARLLGLL